MNPFPPLLTSRLAQIYSKTQMDSLQKVFKQPKKPVTFRLGKNITAAECEDALTKAHIIFTRIEEISGAYMLREDFREKDLWDLEMYQEGKIYIQSIASQLPAHLFDFDENFSGKILDACSAPGGKTSLLARLYPKAKIYALEPYPTRYKKLIHNLKKLDCEQIDTFQITAQNFARDFSHLSFDKILIDAPCSSEGSLSIHNEKFLSNWDMKHIQNNSQRQRDIISTLAPLLSEKGEMIYSTCTLAPEENEEIIEYTLDNNLGLELVDVELKSNEYFTVSGGLESFGENNYSLDIQKKCVRLEPSVHTEGFFIAKLNKISA